MIGSSANVCTRAVFWKFANDAGETQDDGSTTAGNSRLLFTKGYSVFNASQVQGYTPKIGAEPTVIERIAAADAFFGSIDFLVRHGGNRAYYSPMTDHIQMPMFQAFAEKVSYYLTLAHEHTHWTAKDSRCDRQLGKRFGDSAYAAEELIAELGAAFVCAHLGLSSEPWEDHAQYINSWLGVLKADNRDIFTAASNCSWSSGSMTGKSCRSQATFLSGAGSAGRTFQALGGCGQEFGFRSRWHFCRIEGNRDVSPCHPGWDQGIESPSETRGTRFSGVGAGRPGCAVRGTT